MIRWTERAASDLLSIGLRIAADKPGVARDFVERIRERAIKAAAMPRSGRVVPELARDEIREVFLNTYRIVYRVGKEGIVVLTVFEGHRLFGKIDPGAA